MHHTKRYTIQTTLTVGIIYGHTKNRFQSISTTVAQSAVSGGRKLVHSLLRAEYAAADWYDRNFTSSQQDKCVESMICECNKRSCLGYTTSTDTYVRKLRAVR